MSILDNMDLPPAMRSAKGKKYDQGKVSPTLIDPEFLKQLGAVLLFGAGKYGRENWRGGIAISRLLDACYRHLWAFQEGEDFDPESGLLHLGHAACCLMFLVWTIKFRPDLDDRVGVKCCPQEQQGTLYDVHIKTGSLTFPEGWPAVTVKNPE